MHRRNVLKKTFVAFSSVAAVLAAAALIRSHVVHDEVTRRSRSVVEADGRESSIRLRPAIALARRRAPVVIRERTLVLESGHGRLHVRWSSEQHDVQRPGAAVSYMTDHHRDNEVEQSLSWESGAAAAFPPPGGGSGARSLWVPFGFSETDVLNQGVRTRSAGAVISYWPWFVLAIIAPATALAKWARRRRRKSDGLCDACGYDLRATAGRCPECGAAAHP